MSAIESALGSAAQGANLLYPTEATHKKILNGASYTIPENRSTASPSSSDIGSTPTVGAIIYCISSNDSGVNEMANFQPVQVAPGRTVSVAISSNVLTVTEEDKTIFQITGTSLTSAAVSLFHM